jgi:PBSX family phage terminase large subunit
MMQMRLSKKQLDFLVKSHGRINIAHGAVRSGKTFIFNVRWLDYIANDSPPGLLMMVGKTIRSLERNVLMGNMGLFELIGEGNYKYNRSTGELNIGNRTIICIGAADESSEAKIRGLTLSGALCDEVTLYPKNFVEQLLARCSTAGSKLFWNCNPDHPLHYIKTQYLDDIEIKDLVRSFHFLMDDNPALSQEYIEALKRTTHGVFYQRNILGQWARAEGLIYDCFNPQRHVLDNISVAFDRYYVSVDYGTMNPCTFILVGVKGDTHFLLKEYYYDGRASNGRQKTDDEYADDFASFVHGYKLSGIAVDPSAASFIAALRKRKFHITPAKNSVLDGIRTTATFIALDKLFVHKSCENTIKELQSYSWDLKASQQGEDKPLKTQDHAMDALRYYFNTFANKPQLRTFNRSLLAV